MCVLGWHFDLKAVARMTVEVVLHLYCVLTLVYEQLHFFIEMHEGVKAIHIKMIHMYKEK